MLPGLDDGPQTMEDALALARAAAASGTRTLVATPHVSARYPSDREAIARASRALADRLARENVEIEVRPGAEIAMTSLLDLDDETLSHLGLGGSRWLLIEPPFAPSAGGLEILLMELQDRGHPILLAHPERCPTFQREPGRLEALVRAGIRTSITAGSLGGQFGGRVRRFALEMLKADIVHNVASDAHDADHRGPQIASHLTDTVHPTLVAWMTQDVPAAILQGDEALPPPPATAIVSGAGARRAPWRKGPFRRA